MLLLLLATLFPLANGAVTAVAPNPAMSMEQRRKIVRTQTAAFRAQVPNDPAVSSPMVTLGGLETHQGARQYQEDRGIANETVVTKSGKVYKVYGVFDGHGGDRTSTFCKDNFSTFLKDVANEHVGPFSKVLYDTVKKVDLTWNAFNKLRLKKYEEHGTTLNVLVVEEATGRAWIANTGDSRCFMLTRSPTDTKLPNHDATIDHNVESNPEEKKRILDCGGRIDQGYCMWDTNPLGGWAIARHIGSRNLCIATIPHPDVYVRQLKNIELFVLATDGFWDVVSNLECEVECRRLLKLGLSEQDMSKQLMQYGLQRTRFHFKGQLWDNITVVVVSNKPQPVSKDVLNNSPAPSDSPLTRILDRIEEMNRVGAAKLQVDLSFEDKRANGA